MHEPDNTMEEDELLRAAAAAFTGPHELDLVSPIPSMVCLICQRPDDRPLLHFGGYNDIYLHVFCGKTASILPDVNCPDLEILSKAGLKNKHGTGPDVNAALVRTRSAVADKEYYLVREFEAVLEEIRENSKVRCGCGGMHWPPGTAKGTLSYRNHVISERHQRWIQMGMASSQL